MGKFLVREAMVIADYSIESCTYLRN